MSDNQCYAGVSSFPKHRSSWLAVAVIVSWVQNGGEAGSNDHYDQCGDGTSLAGLFVSIAF